MSAEPVIARIHVFWALLSLSLAMLPHAGRFSPWMLVCFGALAGWRVLGEFRLLPLPTRKHVALWILKQLLAVAFFVAIYITYRGQLGRDAGVALLTALLGLKMLELHNARDYYVVMFLAYFLVVTNFFLFANLGHGRVHAHRRHYRDRRVSALQRLRRLCRNTTLPPTRHHLRCPDATVDGRRVLFVSADPGAFMGR